jgi:hypothetical protein
MPRIVDIATVRAIEVFIAAPMKLLNSHSVQYAFARGTEDDVIHAATNGPSCGFQYDQ